MAKEKNVVEEFFPDSAMVQDQLMLHQPSIVSRQDQQAPPDRALDPAAWALGSTTSVGAGRDQKGLEEDPRGDVHLRADPLKNKLVRGQTPPRE